MIPHTIWGVRLRVSPTNLWVAPSVRNPLPSGLNPRINPAIETAPRLSIFLRKGGEVR